MRMKIGLPRCMNRQGTSSSSVLSRESADNVLWTLPTSRFMTGGSTQNSSSAWSVSSKCMGLPLNHLSKPMGNWFPIGAMFVLSYEQRVPYRMVADTLHSVRATQQLPTRVRSVESHRKHQPRRSQVRISPISPVNAKLSHIRLQFFVLHFLPSAGQSFRRLPENDAAIHPLRSHAPLSQDAISVPSREDELELNVGRWIWPKFQRSGVSARCRSTGAFLRSVWAKPPYRKFAPTGITKRRDRKYAFASILPVRWVSGDDNPSVQHGLRENRET